jgi:hypothetical protein
MKTEISEGKQTSHVTHLAKLRRINRVYFNGLFTVPAQEVWEQVITPTFHQSNASITYMARQEKAINSVIYNLYPSFCGIFSDVVSISESTARQIVE